MAKLFSLTWVFALTALFTISSFVGAQPTVRRAPNLGWPLQKQIRPDDRVLILESLDSPPLLVRLPEGDAAIHAMTDHADVAIVVTVTKKRSQTYAQRKLDNFDGEW